jgi:hypothetical protein
MGNEWLTNPIGRNESRRGTPVLALFFVGLLAPVRILVCPTAAGCVCVCVFRFLVEKRKESMWTGEHCGVAGCFVALPVAVDSPSLPTGDAWTRYGYLFCFFVCFCVVGRWRALPAKDCASFVNGKCAAQSRS